MKINIKDWVQQEKEMIKAAAHGIDGYPPSLLIIQIGDNSASNSYIKGKIKDAEECGFSATLFKTTDSDDVYRFLCRNGENYDGIILQEPSGLTGEYREKFLKAIGPLKDVDGFLKDSEFLPCTPLGIIAIIKMFYPDEDLHGVTAAVIGRGELVGKPLVPMLIDEGCTVISCNSKTKDMAELIKKADIVVSAVGKKDLITRDMLKDGAFVVDAGITFDENGKLCGDVDKSIYDDESIAVTPVPGGVGLTTRLALMQNTLYAATEFRRR